MFSCPEVMFAQMFVSLAVFEGITVVCICSFYYFLGGIICFIFLLRVKIAVYLLAANSHRKVSIIGIQLLGISQCWDPFGSTVG